MKTFVKFLLAVKNFIYITVNINIVITFFLLPRNDYSRQFKNNSGMSDHLYKKLKHFTSDESNFILFEPNFGWHRGTHVDTGERIALQVIMKP